MFWADIEVGTFNPPTQATSTCRQSVLGLMHFIKLYTILNSHIQSVSDKVAYQLTWIKIEWSISEENELTKLTCNAFEWSSNEQYQLTSHHCLTADVDPIPHPKFKILNEPFPFVLCMYVYMYPYREQGVTKSYLLREAVKNCRLWRDTLIRT